MSRKNKCNYKIDYMANGEAFITKPGKTIFMAKKIIKKITKINPNSTIGDLEDFQLLDLKYAIEQIMQSSYEHGGATFLTHSDFAGEKGEYTHRFLCYNRKTDADGNPVIKLKTPDGRTTHWSKERQGG